MVGYRTLCQDHYSGTLASLLRSLCSCPVQQPMSELVLGAAVASAACLKPWQSSLQPLHCLQWADDTQKADSILYLVTQKSAYVHI